MLNVVEGVNLRVDLQGEPVLSRLGHVLNVLEDQELKVKLQGVSILPRPGPGSQCA